MFHGTGHARTFKLGGTFASGLVRHFVCGHDIICLCETHLSPTIKDDDIALPGFTAYRTDRTSHAAKLGHGGVVTYVRNDLLPSKVVFLRSYNTVAGIEMIWLRLHLKSHSILICACYFAPENSLVYEGGGDSATQREMAAETAIACLTQNRSFLSTCRHDHKKLWRMLGDEARAACGIQDIGVWTKHFAALLHTGDGDFPIERVHKALRYVNSCLSGHESVGPPVGQLPASALSILNDDITLEEVTAALRRLPNGKSPGNECAPGECYKFARKLRQADDEPGAPEVHRLAPILRILIQHIFETGDFPTQFTTTLVTPVFKKGDPTVPGNYRGIAVGGALAKLYASILLRRLGMVCDKQGLRHPAQAGFRNGFGTAHHLFVKRVLTEKHGRRASLPPLIVVQIDFEKAFDKVPREAIWARLRERGITGRILCALERAYNKVEMRVKMNGKIGGAFPSLLGVKQGDPLSTELFGLFIETLGDLIDAHDADDGPEGSKYGRDTPTLDNQRISLLFYADDVSLLATSFERMRELLRYVDDFCSCFGMRANVKKCERLVFSSNQEEATRLMSKCERLRLQGQHIPAVNRARYLGLVYGPGAPFAACRSSLIDSARGAAFSLLARTRSRNILSADVRMRLFDAQVQAIATYGCEAWGPDMLIDALSGGPPGNRSHDRNNLGEGLFEAALKDEAVRLQTSFMRQCAGAMRPAHRLLYAELGQLPMHYHVFKMLIGFYNRIQKQKHTYCYRALVEELVEAVDARSRPGSAQPNLALSWGQAFLKIIESFVDVWKGMPNNIRRGAARGQAEWLLAKPLLEAELTGAFRERMMIGWAHDRLHCTPDTFPSDSMQPGIHMAKYKHWMGLSFERSAPMRLAPHATCVIPYEAHRCLIRFRLCCWPLAANRNHHLPRSERKCCLCNDGIEDERHVLLTCEAYANIRAKHGLNGTADMKSVMQSTDQRVLASLLRDVWTRRSELLRLSNADRRVHEAHTGSNRRDEEPLRLV